MASSSSEAEADTWSERPTRIQPYQFEPVRQDSERVPEHRVSSRIARTGNTDCYVIKPFSSPQMIMYRSAFCIAMNRLKCLV